MPAERDGPLLQLGYWLSSEEHGPHALVRNAAHAEQAGFTRVGISDHLHPWISQQGQSPFVWSVLGAIAGATDHLHVTTGVTAPIIRMHPAIVARLRHCRGAPGRAVLARCRHRRASQRTRHR